MPAGCGGEIIPDAEGRFEGIFESPNYGHAYHPNLDCLWVLRPNAAATVAANNMIAAFTTADYHTGAADEDDGGDLKVGIEFIDDFDVVTSHTSVPTFLGIFLWRRRGCTGDYVRVSA